MRTKCIIFGETLKVRDQKYDKLSLKIVQTALKWPLQYANFQKISGAVCYRTFLELFLSNIGAMLVEKQFVAAIQELRQKNV